MCQWLPRYNRSWLRDDFVARATLPANAIPVSLAYASLAAVPPQIAYPFKFVEEKFEVEAYHARRT